jgi:hypothetical protein
MNSEEKPANLRASLSAPPWLPTLTRAATAAAAIAILAVTYWHVSSGDSFSPVTQTQADNVSDTERQERLSAFAAQGPLALRAVDPANLSLAADSMELSPSNKKALLIDAGSLSSPTTVTPGSKPSQSEQAATVEQTPVRDVRKSLRLAWITLWDTDVEDGDVVRIESRGYSRTVTLTKRGVTFAVPVPLDGVIRVTGVNDGDGGGITIGLASGATKAIFPIMSPGQSLGLSVTVK